MITNIDLANFKLFRRVSIDPKLITVLIGPNGSGKSAILQALLLLKQSEDAGAALDLKGNLLEIEPGDLLSRFAEVRFQNVYLKLSGSFEMSSTDVGKPVEFEVHLGYDRQGQLSEPKRGSTSFEYRGHRFTASSPQPGDSVRVGELSCVNGRGINVVRVEYSNSLVPPATPKWT